MVVGHGQSIVSCDCCASGEVTAKLRLQKRVFVPGEPILIYAEICNQANVEMISSSVELQQVFLP